MKSTKILLHSLFFILSLAVPGIVVANVQITEVMYDLEGADGGYEWIEITNTGSVSVDVGRWRLFEGTTNHKLELTKGNSTVLSPGISAIIADKPENFFAHWPTTSLVFDSAFSLSNTGETLVLKDGALKSIDEVSYTSELGAKGDGGSLHRKDSAFVPALPTPGVYPGELRAVPVKESAVSAKPTTSMVQKSSSFPSVAVPSFSQLATVQGGDTEGMHAWFAWLLGLMSIVGLGLAAYFLVILERPTNSETMDPADEFEVIDDTGKPV